MRENIHLFYLRIANLYSKRSTCPKLSVGAILVRNNRLLAAGYNGAPNNFEHCNKVIPLCYELNNHCRNTLHAEESLIAFCAKNGISTKGGVIYITKFPCSECTKLLYQAGIIKIYYQEDYKNEENIFKDKIKIIKINRRK